MSIADTLTGFASSLRARLDSINTSLAGKGQTAAGSLAEIPAKIDAIETGADVSGVTAAEGDVLSPKVFVDSSGKPKTGTIITKSASDLTTSGASVVVPAGYYPNEVSKSVATATQATPSISFSSSGVITASATQSAGYVSSGTKSASKQLSTKSATTYTPSTSNQTISSGYYLTGAQTIKGDSNLVASNIKSGVSIFGVSGSYEATGSGHIGTTYYSSTPSSYTNLNFNSINSIGSAIGFYIFGYGASMSSASRNISNIFISLNNQGQVDNSSDMRVFSYLLTTSNKVSTRSAQDDNILGHLISDSTLMLTINDATYAFDTSTEYCCYPIYGS